MTQHLRFHVFLRSALAVLSIGLALTVGCQSKTPTKSEDATTATGAKEKATEKTADAAKPKEASQPKEKDSLTGREVLSRMIVAYRKASTYTDKGKIHLVAEAGKEKIDQNTDFSVVMVRPNKLRVNTYQVALACDGEKLRATVGMCPGEVLEKPAPKKIDMKIFRADPNLAMGISDLAGLPPQLLLLLSDDPMSALLRDAEAPELAESAEIDGRQYYRVRIKGPQGAATLWIDQESLVLRRVVYPTDAMRESFGDAQVDHVSLIADFTGARLDSKIDATAFDFEIPEKAEIVKMFVPPHTAQLLGKPLPDFTFHDLDGKPITRESLAGKPAVLDFWATWCGYCKMTLPELQKVYAQRKKDKHDIPFYAVSVDDPQVDNKELTKAFEGLKVDVPILRGDKDETAKVLKIVGYPTTLIVDAKGIVQYCILGAEQKLSDVLPDTLDKVLAGKNVFEPLVKQYEEQLEKLRQNAEQLEKSAEGTLEPSAGNVVREERLPETPPAPKTEPTTMKLARLWKSADVKSPGNIIVLPAQNGPARLAVVENWRSVAEVGLDGKLIGSVHKINMAEDEAIGNLRVATGADGKRYVVVWMLSGQRCHVLDEDWNLVASYPENALKNPHSGIDDVLLGDLNGDGKLEMLVSYWGVVGVKSVTLDGKPLWSNRSLANVLGMAIGATDDKGQRNLYCTNERGSIAVLNDKGQPNGEVKVPDRMLRWIATADLRGDDKPLWCGIALPKLDEEVAVGFSLDGHELWHYSLPKGAQSKPIEPIIAGRLTREGPSQWIFPGPDGSVHILSADGKPLDKFNTGAALQGLASAQLDGQPVLVTATIEGLTAWKVE